MMNEGLKFCGENKEINSIQNKQSLLMNLAINYIDLKNTREALKIL